MYSNTLPLALRRKGSGGGYTDYATKKNKMTEKIFADGFSFKRNENAPDFVVGRLSMKVDEAIAFIKQHEKRGWINMSIKTARSGNHYVELDTYEPKGREEDKSEPKPSPKKAAPKKVAEPIQDEELPF